MKRRITILLCWMAPLLAASCMSLSSINERFSTMVSQSQILSQQAVTKFNDTTGKADEISVDLKKALEEITPEQEYFIGRAVAAKVLTKYRPYRKRDLNKYLNRLGQSIALYSDRPELYKGYRFIVIDTDEINAFATPSGHVFISRGMIGITNNEDELAAVLAHEIAHITCGHGLKSVRTARFGTALSKAAKSAGEMAGEDLRETTETFSSSINDITNTMIDEGYSKTDEFAADLRALLILKESGYDRRALERVLQNMSVALKPGEGGFARTHPEPFDRIKVLQVTLDSVMVKPAAPNQVRHDRYALAMKEL